MYVRTRRSCFGSYSWRQAERAKIQQLAYAGLRKRSELAKVTLMT